MPDLHHPDALAFDSLTEAASVALRAASMMGPAHPQTLDVLAAVHILHGTLSEIARVRPAPQRRPSSIYGFRCPAPARGDGPHGPVPAKK